MKAEIYLLSKIAKQHPTIVNAIDPDSENNETALDYAVEINAEHHYNYKRSSLVETLLALGSEVNIAGKNRWKIAIMTGSDAYDRDQTDLDPTPDIIHLPCYAGAIMVSCDNRPYKEDHDSALYQDEEQYNMYTEQYEITSIQFKNGHS